MAPKEMCSLLTLNWLIHVGMQIVLFSMGGVQALAAALTPLCTLVLPHQTIHPPFGEVFVHAILSLGLSIATVAVWLIYRSSSWAWALQDLIGMSLIIMVLRQFRLPNIKVSNTQLLSDCNVEKLKARCKSADTYALLFCIPSTSQPLLATPLDRKL